MSLTNFEKLLIDKGYEKYRLNPRTMQFEQTDKHLFSTMGDLDYRYIHKDDPVLEKIKRGKKVTDDDFTREDRKNIIAFGLHEYGKPPTLINPRPKIRIAKGTLEIKIKDIQDNYKIELMNGSYIAENFYIKNVDSDKITFMYCHDELEDDSMNMVLDKEFPEKVFDSLFDSSISFDYDLTNQ